MRSRNKEAGFTLIEALIAIVLVTLCVFMTMSYSTIMGRRAFLTRNVSTKNRVLSGIRDFAGMPATLRASMRAATAAGVVINRELLACAGGNPDNSCEGDKEFDLTMFAPLLERDAAGNIKGVQPISSPPGSATPMRIDTFGSPCSVASPTCPFLIFTTMKAQCGPAPQPATAPSPINLELLPQAKCTVAEVIEVKYYVQLDPDVSTTDPAMSAFVTTVSGSVIVPVIAISGNVPQ
jgi:hypothetical protein